MGREAQLDLAQTAQTRAAHLALARYASVLGRKLRRRSASGFPVRSIDRVLPERREPRLLPRRLEHDLPPHDPIALGPLHTPH